MTDSAPLLYLHPDAVVDPDPKVPFVVGGARAQTARQKIEDAWTAGALVTVTPQFREQLPWISGVDRDDFLRSHPGYIQQQILNSISVSLESMRHALKELLSARYELIVESHQFSGRDRDANDRIGLRATKEFFVLLALSAAQVDMYRRLRGHWQAYGPLIDEFVVSDFSDDSSRVVRVLRNHYTHVLLSELSWSTSTKFGDVKDRHSAELELNTERLIRTGNFSGTEQALLRSKPIEPIDLFDRYMAKAQKLWNAIATYSRSGANPYIENLRETETAICAVNSRQGWKVMLQNFVGKPGIGVYQNLYRFFGPEEIEAILRRLDHSIEQADYAISLKDEYNACDESLREGVRSMFREARPRNGP